jgi:hypothetical protein
MSGLHQEKLADAQAAVMKLLAQQAKIAVQ